MYLVDLLQNPRIYPTEIHSLVVVPSFLHHICLKEGEVREYVLKSAVLENMMQIYTLDELTRILSPMCGGGGGCLGPLFGAFNRFLINIAPARQHIYEGVVRACESIIKEMLVLEEYFDRLLAGDADLVEPVQYENVTFKINNIMRLIIKISSNFNPDGSFDCKKLHNLTERMFRLKYLNIHSPSENKWIGNCARLVDSSKL